MSLSLVLLCLYASIGGWWGCFWQLDIAARNRWHTTAYMAVINVAAWPLSMLYWLGLRGYRL